MYKLYVRRNPCEKWCYWTCTDNMERLVDNIQIVERYGWQWEVRGGSDVVL